MALATKGQAAKEGLSVQEAERVMDIKLFLEEQTKWEADSLHCLMVLYEMFRHATDQGQKAGRADGLLRLLTEVIKAGPQGGHICHPVGRPPN